MKKGLLKAAVGVLAASMLLAACAPAQPSNTSEEPASSSSPAVTYSLSITNEEALTADWRQYDEARTIEVAITASDGSAVNVAELAAEGLISVTVADTSIFQVTGLGLNPVGHGTTKVTVSYEGASAEITLTVSELQMAQNIKQLADLVKRLDDPTANNPATAIEDVWGLKAVVVGVCQGGAFLDDGSGKIIYAYSSEAAKLTTGNYVFGAVSKPQRYHQNILELGSWKTIDDNLTETKPTTNFKEEDRINMTAAEYAKIDFDSKDSILNEWVPIKFVGTMFKSGSYDCFYPEDVPLKQNVATSKTATADKDMMIELQGHDATKVEAGKVYEVEAFAVYDGKYCYVGAYPTKITEANVAPTAISASLSVAKLFKGFDAKVVTDFTPKYTTNKGLNYVSSDANILTVDENGNVHAVEAGTATITVTSKAKDTVTAQIAVTVLPEAVKLQSVALDKETATLKEKKTLTLTPTIVDVEGGTNHVDTVKWASSDETVATVDENGKVTAVKAGTANITVTTDGVNAAGEKLTATCAVTVEAWNYGTKDAPLSVANAIELIKEQTGTEAKHEGDGSKTWERMWVKGTVISETATKYGATYDIKDADAENKFEVYSANLNEAKDYPYVNDEVISYGFGTYYASTKLYELTSGSLNGQTVYPIAEVVTHKESIVSYSGNLLEGDSITLKNGEATVESGASILNGTSLTATISLASGHSIYSVKVNDKNVTANENGTYTVVVAGPTTLAVVTELTGTVHASIAPEEIAVGETAQITATSLGVAEDTYTYESAAPAIATVDESGKVTGVAVGSAEITVKSVKNPTFSAKVTIAVEAAGTVKVVLATGTANESTANKVTWTKGDMTVTAEKGSSRTNANSYTSNDHFRFYGGQKLTIKLSKGKIGTVQITCTNASNATNLAALTVTGATAAANGSDVVFTAAADTAEIVITNQNSSGHVRMSLLKLVPVAA